MVKNMRMRLFPEGKIVPLFKVRQRRTRLDKKELMNVMFLRFGSLYDFS